MVDARRCVRYSAWAGNFIQPRAVMTGWHIFFWMGSSGGGRQGPSEWRSKCSNLRYDNSNENEIIFFFSRKDGMECAFMTQRISYLGGAEGWGNSWGRRGGCINLGINIISYQILFQQSDFPFSLDSVKISKKIV